MKQVLNFLYFILIFVTIQGCNTLYNSRTINLEVAVPGKTSLTSNFKTIAVRYNNCNVAPSPIRNAYIKESEVFPDTTKIDSLASEVYYNIFVEMFKKSKFVDSLIELQSEYYSDINLIDTLIKPITFEADTLAINLEAQSKLIVLYFTTFLKENPIKIQSTAKTKLIDPEFGLYSKTEIQQIADSTGADLLLSLDYYNSLDGLQHSSAEQLGVEWVIPTAYWNVYDLQNCNLKSFKKKADTISWNVKAQGYKYAEKHLPSRKDAVLNAADIAATRFAEYLIPHWIEVQRLYYQSGHVDLKQTDQLVEENRWIEAVEIWKANIHNPNKSIAAKCMFNMALACEMEGNLDAALEWVVKSFHVFGQKNEVHFYNCTSYIQILGQRKLDMKKLEFQINPKNS